MSGTSPFCEKVKSEVVARLKGEAHPHKKIGLIVMELIRKEFAAPGASTRSVLQDACFGAMNGLVLLDKDVAPGAVSILHALVEVIQERSGDPMRTMSFALEGIARVAPMVSRDAIHDMTDQIEVAFMGAGQEFTGYVESFIKKD